MRYWYEGSQRLKNILEKGITTMANSKIWYEISSEGIARRTTLKQLKISKEPVKGDKMFSEFSELMKKNRSLARGIKYGVESYSLMYMKERERILGDWKVFLSSLCRDEGISTDKVVFVGGINDGQEVSFFKGKVIGLDISLDAVSRGKDRYNNISFIVGDLMSFDNDGGSIDTYILLRTIHFFSETERMVIINKAFSCLKRNGRILVSIPGGFLTKTGDIVFGQRMADALVDIKKPMKDAIQIAEIMRKAGFVKVKTLNHKIEIFIVGKKKKG
jgi:hypothetical protein